LKYDFGSKHSINIH